MRTLADHVRDLGSETDAKTVEKVFAGLGMPIPYLTEIAEGNDGMLLFLNHHGCVMRMQYQALDTLADHPHILQPLGRRQVDDLLIDINPGIPGPARSRDTRGLKRTLAEDRIIFSDLHRMNAGYLPEVAGLIKKRQFPVVIDAGAVTQLGNTIQEINALFPGIDLPLPEKETPFDPQRILYVPLREAFNAAWPETEPLPDTEKMAAFWDKCAAFKQEGKLVASWLTLQWKMASFGLSAPMTGNYKNANGGVLYAQRWPSGNNPR